MAKKIEQSVEERFQVLRSLTDRASLAAKLGQQFGGDRNIYEALGYKTDLTFDDYAARYARQDIARAVIDRPVAYTWKGELGITEVDSTEETELQKAWAVLEKDLKLKSKFSRLDKLSSIGSYGALLLGFDDVRQKEEWTKPIEEGKRKLLYVRPLSEGHAAIKSYEKKPNDPRYGMVDLYDITFTEPSTNSTNSFPVHHSRVLHVVPNPLESEVDGSPVLEAVYNRLMDLEKLVGGSAEMFWKGARPGYQGVAKDDYALTPDVEEELQDQLDEFENNLRRFIVNEGIELQALAPQVSSPTEHVDVQIQMISAVTGIPKRILTGTERGELASGQDVTSWYSTVQSRREEHAEPNIIIPFVDLMIKYKILPEPSTGDYQVQWSDLFASSDKDKAEIGRIRATSLREYVQNPLAAAVLPPEAFMKWFLGLDEDKVDEIQKMSSEMILEEALAMALTQPEPTGTQAPNEPAEPTGDNND